MDDRTVNAAGPERRTGEDRRTGGRRLEDGVDPSVVSAGLVGVRVDAVALRIFEAGTSAELPSAFDVGELHGLTEALAILVDRPRDELEVEAYRRARTVAAQEPPVELDLRSRVINAIALRTLALDIDDVLDVTQAEVDAIQDNDAATAEALGLPIPLTPPVPAEARIFGHPIRIVEELPDA